MEKEERRCSKVPRTRTARTRISADRESESEGLDAQPEPGHPVAGEDVGTPEGGPGAGKSDAAPEIGGGHNEEETQRPAPDDEVGVPENPGEDEG